MIYIYIGALLFGFLLGRQRQSIGLTFIDVVFAIAMGVLSSFLATFYLSKLHLDFPYFESDFVDYCINIIHFNDDTGGADKRTKLAGIVAYFFSQHLGVVNGIAAASICSLSLVYTTIYLWATCISGRLAGLICLFIGLTMTPIISLGSILNFYPFLIAVFAIGALGTTLSIIKPKPFHHLIAGIGIGMCLLIDVRGSIWAFSFLVGILCFGWSWRKGLKYNVILTICLFVPIVFSWHLGQWSYPPNAKSLEAQIDVRPLYQGLTTAIDDGSSLESTTSTLNGNEVKTWRKNYKYNNDFVWGRTNLLDLPHTANFLYYQTKIEPPNRPLNSLGNTNQHRNYHHFWNTTLLYALMVIALTNRNRRRLLAIGISGAPFIIAFIGTKEMVEFQLRFYSHSLPFMAVIVSVACVSLMKGQGVLQWKYRPLTYFILVILLYAITIGAVDSPLSPTAPWRPHWKANTKSLNEIQQLSLTLNGDRLSTQSGQKSRLPSWQLDCALRIAEEENRVWIYEEIERKLPGMRHFSAHRQTSRR